MYRSEVIKVPDNPSQNWRVDTADCFADVLDFIRRKPAVWPSNQCSSMATHGELITDADKKMGLTDGWAGTKTLDEALRLGELGWDQGRALLSESLDAANVVQKQARVLAEGLDVAGYNPFVPAAVAGDPLCMTSGGLDRAKSKPVFRIMVSGSVSAGVSMQTVIHRGAAVLSWVDKLESVGYQCEILYIHDATAGSSGVCRLTHGFPIKEAGEPLSIDRAAFMLAHPAMLRRIVFALYERFDDVRPNFNFGYGCPSNNIPPSLVTDHSIYFPCLHADREDWKNPATAILAVERAIIKALTHEGVDEDIREQMEWAAA